MTTDQAVLFAILGVVFVLLLWGRWRYDIVAFGALVVALVAGLVPANEAFAGFGHPATVIIALVLIVSRGLAQSGAIEIAARLVIDPARALTQHIAIMGTLAAGLSAVMNNVAALALLMPVDLQAAKAAGRRAGATLMPLSYASILGGMVTLIGTPPNIVISAFREDSLGAPFAMFDFAPVGLAVAACGVAFIVLGGWRLIPVRGDDGAGTEGLSRLRDIVSELVVQDKSSLAGQVLREAEAALGEQAVELLAIVRGGVRLDHLPAQFTLRSGDILVVEAASDALEPALGKLGLAYPAQDDERWFNQSDLAFAQAVLPEGAVSVGRSATGLGLRARFGVQLVGLGRQGRRLSRRVRHEAMQAGDLVFLLGPSDQLAEAIEWLGAMPLEGDDSGPIRRRKALPAVGLFAAAIISASLGWLYLPVALAAVAVLYVLLGIVPLRQLYTSIEWPVIVLLGAMIPLGSALESTGATTLIVDGMLQATAGQPAVVILAILMLVTMTLSDVMNNTATAVIAAPIAVQLAAGLAVNPDPFLMAVTVGASCAFLTPIGHKNNMLVMGPAGYRFGDYWRLGLPLEILVIVVSIPAILLVWPL